MKAKYRPVVLFLWGTWMLWGFGFQTVWKRLQTEISGTVLSSRDIHPSRAPTRYSTEYLIRGDNGQDRIYVAGPTDGSLPRSMPIGTKIKKLRWNLDYEMNDARVHFPMAFYAVILGVSLMAILWSLVLWRSQQ
jgi:hypothetical protein